MITLYYWPTPNCWKITILLEELGLDYKIEPVNITAGEQHADEYRQVCPTSKVPAIVDGRRETPITIFESGAILQYLAQRQGRFLPAGEAAKSQVTQWLFWQVSALGPISGQANHFIHYAEEKLEYAQRRFTTEYRRLLGILDRRLSESAYLGGSQYTIADISVWPWILPYRRIIDSLDSYPNLQRWRQEIKSRDAVQRGIAVGAKLIKQQAEPEVARKALFG